MTLLIIFYLGGMDTEEGAKQKNLAMAKKKFNMDHKKVKFLRHFYFLTINNFPLSFGGKNRGRRGEEMISSRRKK